MHPGAAAIRWLCRSGTVSPETRAHSADAAAELQIGGPCVYVDSADKSMMSPVRPALRAGRWAAVPQVRPYEVLRAQRSVSRTSSGPSAVFRIVSGTSRELRAGPRHVSFFFSRSLDASFGLNWAETVHSPASSGGTNQAL